MASTYLTGAPISTTAVEWTGTTGVRVSLTLMRSARLSANGWLPTDQHSLVLAGNGREVPFYGRGPDGELLAQMGRITIAVPAEHRVAVDALLAEHNEHNAAALATSERQDAEYATHVARIERAMCP